MQIFFLPPPNITLVNHINKRPTFVKTNHWCLFIFLSFVFWSFLVSTNDSTIKYLRIILFCMCLITSIARFVFYRKYKTKIRDLKKWILPTKQIIGSVCKIIPIQCRDSYGITIDWYIIVAPDKKQKDNKTYKSEIMKWIRLSFSEGFNELFFNHHIWKKRFDEYIKDHINIGDKYLISIDLYNPDLYIIEPIRKSK